MTDILRWVLRWLTAPAVDTSGQPGHVTLTTTANAACALTVTANSVCSLTVTSMGGCALTITGAGS